MLKWLRPYRREEPVYIVAAQAKQLQKTTFVRRRPAYNELVLSSGTPCFSG